MKAAGSKNSPKEAESGNQMLPYLKSPSEAGLTMSTQVGLTNLRLDGGLRRRRPNKRKTLVPAASTELTSTCSADVFLQYEDLGRASTSGTSG